MRRIWGDADAVLLVFAGAAAEFALNRAVDWLFFTGAIPADPIGRLFRTAAYAQEIVFASRATAEQTLARIRTAHAAVEQSRGAQIPDWAHRDVLYLLIDYSERAETLLRGALTPAERDDLYDVFRRVGEGLAIARLPPTYADWRPDRERHMRDDLAYSEHTAALYARYREQLGPWRYGLLRHLQALLSPRLVADLLRLPRRTGWTRPAIAAYRALRHLRLAPVARLALVPREHLGHVRGLDKNCEL
ncbi:MAG: oxygenase MpaB family protein [Gemmatimonadaceae bacterium]